MSCTKLQESYYLSTTKCIHTNIPGGAVLMNRDERALVEGKGWNAEAHATTERITTLTNIADLELS
jgi:hypothetical protein